jgi:AcrR family transcriptional regulator
MPPADQPRRAVSPALLAAAGETLRRLGPRRFSLTAVAEAAGVSRGTVHNAFGSRDYAIRTALDHLAAAFVETMAAEVERSDTLVEQVSAAAILTCAHRQRSDHVAPGGVNESIVVLLLRNIGDDLVRRAIDLWKPLVKAAQSRGEIGSGVDPARAAEWIVRVLFSFELLPPMGVNLDSPRAVKRFVTEFTVAGLTGTHGTAGRSEATRETHGGHR